MNELAKVAWFKRKYPFSVISCCVMRENSLRKYRTVTRFAKSVYPDKKLAKKVLALFHLLALCEVGSSGSAYA